jgi:hypothetical protein
MERPRVLAFDVFGTLVDWRTTIAREVDALDLGVDGDRFALAWRAGYVPAMQRVAQGVQGWSKLDELHRSILDAVLEHFAITRLDEQAKRELNRVWHRLDAWPDSAEGLAREASFAHDTFNEASIKAWSPHSKRLSGGHCAFRAVAFLVGQTVVCTRPGFDTPVTPRWRPSARHPRTTQPAAARAWSGTLGKRRRRCQP